MMHRFTRKNFLVLGIVAAIVTILAIAMRPSVRTADADSGNIIQKRNARIQEAFRLAEGR